MSDFVFLFMDSVWVIFPIMIYLIYEVYTENVNKKKNDLVLSFCLFSSLYLIIRFGVFDNKYLFSVVFDFIILFFYFKKKILDAVIVSIIVSLYLKYNFDFYLLIVLKYFSYFYLYQRFSSNLFFLFTFFISFVCFMFFDVSLYIVFQYIIYYMLIYFVIFFFTKGEKIIEINLSYKELMRENQVRQSLFKISHEIKNPIAVCKGYLDMFDINNINHFKKYIPIISSEIDKTLNLLQDFSACNKISINCDIIDITLLIQDIMNNFKLMFNDNGISFNVDNDFDEVFVYGDYNRLNQVMVNIIKNSIEAVDLNKESYINIRMEKDDSYVKIYVLDNGVGMDDETLSRVSEPFYTTKKNGTGLGVLLSMEIIKAHNGTLCYESSIGKGTTVVITLPIYNI